MPSTRPRIGSLDEDASLWRIAGGVGGRYLALSIVLAWLQFASFLDAFGRSVHRLLFVAAVSIAVAVVGWRAGAGNAHRRPAIAFVVGYWLVGYSVATVGAWVPSDRPPLSRFVPVFGSVGAQALVVLAWVSGWIPFAVSLLLASAILFGTAGLLYRRFDSSAGYGPFVAAAVGLVLVALAFFVLVRPGQPCENLFTEGRRIGPYYLMVRQYAGIGIDTDACTHWISPGYLVAGLVWAVGGVWAEWRNGD